MAHERRSFANCQVRRSRDLAIIGAVALLLTLTSRAAALDSGRPLSQALLRIWQSQQGLPRAAIFSIRQTSEGYLWLGTQAGLYRFDGARFVEATGGPSNPLSKLWIQDLAEDREHRLWIATDDAGLACLREGVVTFLGVKEGLPSLHVRRLLVDRQGTLWIGTDQGLARYHDDKITVYRTVAGLPSNDIRALCEADDGTIWIGTGGPHLCQWKGTDFQPADSAALPLRGTIHALQTGAKETLWIGTSAGLVRRTPHEERYFTTVDGLGDDLVYCLATAGADGLWVGTKDGLCRIQGDRVERFQSREGLSQSTVFALCEDQEGSLWVGTKHGLNQLVDRRTLLPFTTSEGLPSNDTGPILQDASGNIWVGTLGAGLAKFDGRRFASAATTENGLPSNTILSLAGGADGELWIGTQEGLCRWKSGQIVDRFTTAEDLPSNRIQSLCRDPTGALWVGTAAGIAELRDGRFIPPEGNALVVGKSVLAMVHYPGKYLVVSTAGGGLFKLVDRVLSPLGDHVPSSLDVDALYLDQKQRLWMAIRGQGLGLLDGDQFVQFGVKDGLYDDDIFGIAGDDKGQLWMACSRGIFSVSLADLQQFSEGKATRLTSTPFSPTDALRTIECQNGVQPAVWKMRDGRIWFSTIRGIIVVDPQRFVRLLPKPVVLVEEVRVNGQEVSKSQWRNLPPGRTNIDFQYTALSLASPGRISFRYKLEGFDKDWVEAGSRREAFYTNLSPGDYRFQVQATNSDGTRHEAVEPIEFTIAPYFYQTTWFIPLVVAGLAGCGWLAYRLRIRQVKGRLQAVLAERSRIARELHDTLIQGFSGVTMQLQALTMRLHNSPERETLSEIIDDAGGCLSEARRSVAGLRNPSGEESGLAAAIAQAARQLTETGDVRLRLRLASVASEFKPDVEYNILRIVQEAIANAIKHSGASMIDVTMRTDRQSLAISVQDDGSGFDMAHHLDQVQPGHYGLIGMRERATQIGATINWRSEPRRGTTVTLLRPLSRTAAHSPATDSTP